MVEADWLPLGKLSKDTTVTRNLLQLLFPFSLSIGDISLILDFLLLSPESLPD